MRTPQLVGILWGEEKNIPAKELQPIELVVVLDEASTRCMALSAFAAVTEDSSLNLNSKFKTPPTEVHTRRTVWVPDNLTPHRRERLEGNC